MENLTYLFSLIALAMMTAPSMLKGKNMKGILILLCLGNAFMGTSYLLDGGVNGAVASFIGVITTAINFTLEIKHKPIPNLLVACYMLSSVILNLWVSHGIDLSMILVIASAIAYQMSVTRKNGAQYRFWILLNLLIWCLYDFISASYSVLLTHCIQLVITVVSMIIHDRKVNE